MVLGFSSFPPHKYRSTNSNYTVPTTPFRMYYNSLRHSNRHYVTWATDSIVKYIIWSTTVFSSNVFYLYWNTVNVVLKFPSRVSLPLEIPDIKYIFAPSSKRRGQTLRHFTCKASCCLQKQIRRRSAVTRPRSRIFKKPGPNNIQLSR
jgi:hypothetical protein